MKKNSKLQLNKKSIAALYQKAMNDYRGKGMMLYMNNMGRPESDNCPKPYKRWSEEPTCKSCFSCNCPPSDETCPLPTGIWCSYDPTCNTFNYCGSKTHCPPLI